MAAKPIETMGSQFDLDSALQRFSGVAPIFPLPNVVFYPHVMLPLHIFEPRYREMVMDALIGEKYIAIALLKPNWEADYESKSPEIHNTVCLGQIVHDVKLPDGRFNIALRGLSRASVVSEIDSGTPYRIGELELQPDYYSKKPVIDRENRQRELLAGFREMFPHTTLEQVFHQAVSADIPLGGLCDVIAHSLEISPSEAQLVLEELDVDLRSDLLLSQLRSMLVPAGASQTGREFPPPFSLN